MTINIHFITGGMRSGKSAFAQKTALQLSNRPVIIATAEAFDDEMKQRIEHHRQQRVSKHWQLIEEPLLLSQALQHQLEPGAVIVVDCLTVWITNCLVKGDWEVQRQLFIDSLQVMRDTTDLSAEIILVSNEVGYGIVPLGKLSRDFIDASGFLGQTIAQNYADKVTLMVAGLPQHLKNNSHPINQ